MAEFYTLHLAGNKALKLSKLFLVINSMGRILVAILKITVAMPLIQILATSIPVLLSEPEAIFTRG